MAPDINTVFLMPPREMAELSSSMVMGMVGPEGWGKTVRRYVPSPVFDALVTKHSH
jgi:pantetheine-phosphate adenylyltransferase